ncbi:MAG: hypothetical protein NC238_02365 [Dehalobacter sp.]|nr:hypothetical protein [Dehalobacter sp.]
MDFSDFKMPKIELQKLEIPRLELNTNLMNTINDSMREREEAITREKQEEREHREAVLAALQGIEKNTSGISELILLVSKNDEKQDEIFDLLVEVLSIAKAKDKEEAESIYRKVMKKIGDFSGDIETIQKLFGWAGIIFSMVGS